MKTGIIILLIILLLLVLVGHRRQVRAERAALLANQHTTTTTQTPSAGQPSFTLGAGTHEFNILNGSETRKYLAYVPSSYDKSKATPLVLMYHGGGGHMEQAASDYRWKEKADKEGFIVVFGNGASRFPRGHLATWNAGNCCGYARDTKSDDVGYTRALIRDAETKFNIDTNQVFVTGMSNGGIMAHRLACEMADTFRAVASVTGTDGDGACTPSKPISVLHIHAKNDDHVLFNGGAGEGAFRDKEAVADFVSVPETIARWVKRNNANPTPTRVLEVDGAYCDLYTSPDGTQVKLCVTETGGHSWPGGKPVRDKTPSTAISATDTIWDFFKAQVK